MIRDAKGEAMTVSNTAEVTVNIDAAPYSGGLSA
jgi:hypothetical protein